MNTLSSHICNNAYGWLLGFIVLFSTQLSYGQERDTSQWLKEIRSIKDQKSQIDSLLHFCNYLNDQRDYAALQYYSNSTYVAAENSAYQKGLLESCYYLSRAYYGVRNLSQCTFYALEGLDLALSLDDKQRQASFFNSLGIVERRLENCPEAIEYYKKAIDINIEILDSIQLSRNYNNLSVCYQISGEMNASFDALEKALQIRQLQKDTVGIANIYMNIGNNFEALSNNKMAFENYIKAQEYYKLAGNEGMVADAHYNIGLIYQNLSDFDQSMEYYGKALKIAIEQEIEYLVPKIYQNIGNLYNNQNKYTEGIIFHKKALLGFDNLDKIGSKNDVMLNLGLMFMKTNNLDSAEYYLEESLELSKVIKNDYDISNAYVELGRLYTLQKRYAEAVKHLEKGKAIAEERDDLPLISFANQYLYELYNTKGETEAALGYYRTYREQRDSLNILSQEQEITKIKAQFDFEKQESAIALLNKENELKDAEAKKASYQRNLSFAMVGFMFVLAGFIYFQFRFSKKKNAIITKEKERSEELLLNILPEETAHELKEKGTVAAKKFDLTTVLFTDFANFTYYAEHVDPVEVVKSVDYYFSAFDAIVEKHGVEKIKTIGDAYMCVGGLPVPSKDNPLAVVKAGIEMIKFVEKAKQDIPAGIHAFEIRIGINTGPVVAGVVGIKKFQYDIWGDTVNIAARMESASEVGKINISESTYQLVKESVSCIERGFIEIKSKGKLMMYYIDTNIA